MKTIKKDQAYGIVLTIVVLVTCMFMSFQLGYMEGIKTATYQVEQQDFVR